MTVRKFTFIFLFTVFGLISACKKGAGKDFGGYQNKDFQGTWTLKALLYDHDEKGFDSATDIDQLIPATAGIILQLNSDGTLQHINKGKIETSGNWNITERHNANDKNQKLMLWPNIFGENIQCDIETKTDKNMFLFYWEYDHRDSHGFEVFVRKGFWYEK